MQTSYPWNRRWTASPCNTVERSVYPGLSPRVVLEDEFDRVAGVVLLGEPGLGKTFELDAQSRPYVDSGVAPAVYGPREWSKARWVSNVKRTTAYRNWVDGQSPFYLFVDSLDETTGEDVFGDAAELARGGGDPRTFRVRVTCRTLFWGQLPDLASEFADIWRPDGGEPAGWVDYPGQERHPNVPPPEHEVCELHLCPLSDADLLAAARAEGLADPESFVRQVEERGASEVARTPDTLATVIEIYRERGEVPRSRVEVYQRAVPEMAAEHRRNGTLQSSARDRLAAARRAAGVLTFSERQGIVSGRSRREVVSDGELVGGTEPLDENGPAADVEVHQGLVTETLATALFAKRGTTTVGFGRPPVREFLAADWLRVRDIPIQQVLPLLRSGGHVRPRMAETTAWCASMRADVFDAVVGHDPEVLLKSDLHAISPERRRTLTLSLLENEESGRGGWPLLPNGLAYDGVADDLRPWIEDASRGEGARYLAVRLARATGSTPLAQTCLDVGLDPAAPTQLRHAAVGAAVALLGRGADALDRLLPLLRGEAGADPHHDLRGLAAAALVPERVSPFEALERMPVPDEYRPNDPFLEAVTQTIIPALNSREARLAGRWAAWCGDPLASGVADVVHSAVLLRLAALGEMQVAPQVARAAYQQGLGSGQGPRPVYDRWTQDPELRRAVIRALVERGDDSELDLIEHSRWSPHDLIRDDDTEWLVEQYGASRGAERERWADMVGRRLDPAELVRLHGSVPPPADPVRGWYHRPLIRASGGLMRVRGGPLAQDLLNPGPTKRIVAVISARQRRRNARDRRTRLATEAAAAASAATALAAAVDPGTGSWLRVASEMRLTNQGKAAQRSDRWDDLDVSQQAAVVDHALAELADLAASPPSDYGRRLRAKAALYTVFDAGKIGEVSQGAWQGLARVLVYEGPSGDRDDSTKDHATLLKRAYARAPQEVLGSFEAGLLDQLGTASLDNGPGGNVYGYVAPVYDAATDAVVKKVMATHPPGAGPLREALEVLLYRRDPDALDLAATVISDAVALPRPRPKWESRRLTAAARALLKNGFDRATDILSSALDRDPWLLDDVVFDLGHAVHEEGAFGGLNPDGLADLYRRVVERWGYDRPDRASGLSFHPGPADHLERVRSKLVEALRDRGEASASGALAGLVASYPQLGYVHRRILRGWATAATPAPEPTELLRTVDDASRRWVRTDEELHAVVVEATRAFGRWLQDDEQPGVYTLWNVIRSSEVVDLAVGVTRLNVGSPAPLVKKLKGVKGSRVTVTDPRTSRVREQKAPTTICSPKAEAELSDALARFLRVHLDGVVVGREPEVKRGHLLDLTVSTPRPKGQPGGPLQVMVEVKPSWSPQVVSALRDQLADAYLNESERRFGVYVAAVYGPERWFDTNPKREGSKGGWSQKKKRAGERTVAELRDLLVAEAEDIVEHTSKVVDVVVLDASLPPSSAT